MLKFRKFLLCIVLVLSLVLAGTGTIASFEVVPEDGNAQFLLIDDEHTQILSIDALDIAELDPDKMDVPPDAPPLVPPPTSGEEEVEIAALQAYMATSTLGPSDSATIDVMIIYTPAAEDWAESRLGINHYIAQAMLNAQTVMDNSKTCVTLRLVHSARVDYTESGNSYTDLSRLTGTGDGKMDEVHQWRDRYGADLVQLFCILDDGFAGRAWLLTSESGRPAYGFSVTYIRYSADSNYVPIHEMGHNLGCHHHKEQNYQPGPGLFYYSAGWRWTQDQYHHYCSVMTYQSGQYFEDGITHDRVPYFSNPNVYYNGIPTGHSVDGDNARTIREIKHVIAAYRESHEATTLELSPGTGENPLGEDHDLTATVYDQFGYEMEGVAVTWTIESGPGSFVFQDTTTDVNGEADAVITSSFPGTSTVRCESPGITQVSAGREHTVGLKSDGTVVTVGCGGVSPKGQCDVCGWTDIVQVDAGYYHTVGLKSDGTVVAAGNEGWDYGQCDVGGWTDITQVDGCYMHTVGLKSDGTVVAVGSNEYGQCDVGGWTDITQVAAGYYHTVGLKSDGTVVAVGRNNFGQCNVGGWTDITQVAAGVYRTVGLKSDGTVVAVGWNIDGQCDVGGWTDITQVAADYRHTVGLKSDGTVVAVGFNEDGQCDVGGWTDITQVAAGSYHTVGLKSDGTVVAVGWNEYGQCNVDGWRGIVYATATKDWTYTPELTTVELLPGTGSNPVDTTHDLTAWVKDQFGYGMEDVAVTWSITGVGSFSGTPEGVTDAGGQADAVITSSFPGTSTVKCEVPGITEVAAGMHHTVGLKSDGTVVAVGYNAYGQCNVGGWTNIIQIAAGDGHTVGVKSDGTVVAVGDNYYGQCNVGGWTDIIKVAAGEIHTVGLKTDGTVVAVGYNAYGQCNVGGWTDITQVAAGLGHTVGLKSGGTVVALGWNAYGQCDVGGWTDITQVAADSYHTVGLKSDGTVVAVGYNNHGQCNVGGWTDITQVAAGHYYTVGLKTDGTVVAVGDNDYGQCNVGGWTDIIQVAAGFYHTVGFKSDGTVVAVGLNHHGQCDVDGWRVTVYDTATKDWTYTPELTTV